MSAQKIEVGQRWRSKDKRDCGVVAEVLAVDCDGYGNGFVTIKRFRRSRIRANNLRSMYTLVSGGEQ